MRWTIVFIVCLAVASAMYHKKSRFGQMLKNVANLENELEHDVEDWSDEDSEENSDEDGTWLGPQRHHYQPQHKKQQQKQHKPCLHCTDSKRQSKWNPRDEDEDDSQEDEEYRQPKPKKHHQRREQTEEQVYPSGREEDEPKPCQPRSDLFQTLGEVNTQLAAKLHREAKEMDNDKNTVVSPVAVQLALAAVAQGARGNTKRQLNQILDFGLPKNQYQNAYAALIRSLKGQGEGEGTPAQIKATTSLILGQQSAREQFIEAIKTCFDGEVKKCDFRQKPQQCRDQINQWVVSKTGLKSQTVLAPSAVTGNTKMISIAAMQLKTNWGKQFRKSLKTTQGRFYPLGDQKPITVKTLQAEGDFNYFENEQMQVLGVPTQEKQLTIYLILPKDRHGLSHLEKQQVQYGKQLQELMDRCDSKKQTVKVQLPAFQIAYKMDTKQMLRKLGVEDAFDGDVADFSGVIDETEREEVLHYGRRQAGGLEDIDVKKATQQYKEQHQLYLNKMVQLATIQVDENGIDAAGGSRFKQAKPDGDDEKDDHEKTGGKQFQADHAFAFIVKHNPTNQLLFTGRVVDATQKAETEGQRNSESDRE